MVATHKDTAQRSSAIDHLIWIGAVTDNVAQVPHHVMRWRSSDNGVKRLQVGVDIRKDKCAHG
jgi:hypothetical protein